MMILELVIIVIIIIIVFNSKTDENELETIIDIFDKSNEITVISSILNDYIANNNYTNGKHFLMFSIIRKLIYKKRTELSMTLSQYFINNIQIALENEIANNENNIMIYRSYLNSKLSKILLLDNIKKNN